MPDNSFYPQPPAQNGLLSDPTKLLGAIGQINALNRFQSEQGALGAYRDSLGSNGVPDPQTLARGLQRSGSTFGAPEVMSSSLAQQGQGIANTTAQLAQRQAQVQAVMDQFGALGNNPKASKEDLFNTQARVSRMFDPAVVPSSMINEIAKQIANDPEGVAAGGRKLQAQSAGPASMNRVAGPPDASGAPTQVPLGQMHVTGGASPTGLPLGAEQSNATMQADLQRARNFKQEIFPLEQARTALRELGPGGVGPGTAGRQSFASFVYTMSPELSKWLPGVDPESLKKYDEAKKYLSQATMTRLQGFGHGTDQQLATALSSNPNVQITDLAAKELTEAAIATRRMEHAQTLNASKAGPVGYAKAAADFAAGQDPRAYAIDMMSPEKVAQLKKTLTGPERDKFNRSLKMAIDAGVVTPGGAAK